jgi:predicted nucleic acid-binding protein
LIFADSSYLLALYLATDRFSAQARQIAIAFTAPIAYPLLIEVEVINTVWRAVGERRLPKQLARIFLRDIDQDLNDGFLQRCALDAASHYREAMELSERYAARYLTRALDVLHIAAALEMQAAAFVSFDQRQRKLAAEVGLTLLPASFDSQ